MHSSRFATKREASAKECCLAVSGEAPPCSYAFEACPRHINSLDQCARCWLCREAGRIGQRAWVVCEVEGENRRRALCELVHALEMQDRRASADIHRAGPSRFAAKGALENRA